MMKPFPGRHPRTALARVMLAGLAMLAPALRAADYYDLQAERTARNIAAVQDYAGTLEQQGLYGKATLVSEIAFRRPHEFRVRVVSPPELAGTLVSYHDNELLTYWPRQELALRIAGFVPPAAASERQRVADAYALNLENYLYGLGPIRDVAGLPTVQLDQRARNAAQLVQSSLTRVYDDFSFPLAGQVTFRGGAKLDYTWKKISFNDPARILPPVPALPPATMVVSWDLGWPARSAQDLAARVPRALPFPERFAGLARERLLVHPEALPAVGAWYRNDDYYLLVTASRDTGWNPFAAEYGLAVPFGGTTARLVVSPLNSSWAFRRDGLLYEVLTNLHPEVAYRELLARLAPPVVATAEKPAAVPAPAKQTRTGGK